MKIKVKEESKIEAGLKELGATHKQATLIGAAVRSIAGDIMNGRKKDEIILKINGITYYLTLERN